ncbi:Protein F32D8.1 [Aphelenchoides avenae]|nr:Protein F32D8.1 [Aphelenchus avenae]
MAGTSADVFPDSAEWTTGWPVVPRGRWHHKWRLFSLGRRCKVIHWTPSFVVLDFTTSVAAMGGDALLDTTRPRRNSSVAAVGRRSSVHYREGCSLDRNNNTAHATTTRESKILSAKENVEHEETVVAHCDALRQLRNRAAFHKHYEIGGLIGQGNFSDVFVVYSQDDSGKYAAKEIDKMRMAGKLYFIENEVSLLRGCDHPNICKLVDAFECTTSYFLVFEYAPKGDLFELIKRMRKLSEQSSARVTYQIASALQYLHVRKICHRDVKPENVLIGNDFTVKLADFGLATIVSRPLYRLCGTPTYVAPEVLTQEGYGVEVDIWSLGILLHIMLIGFAPFRCQDRSRLFRLIMRASLPSDMPYWSRISPKSKELILKMLTRDVGRRVRATEIMNNSWVQNHL